MYICKIYIYIKNMYIKACYLLFSKVSVLPYQCGGTYLKLPRIGCLSTVPCIGQGTTFSLLLNVPLPLFHQGTAGKLQAHNIGNAMVVLDRFVNIRVLLSVIT